MEKDKHSGLRINTNTHEKLKSLAEFDGRSINGEVPYLIRQAIFDLSYVYSFPPIQLPIVTICSVSLIPARLSLPP